jgi:hypothetical protein
MEPFPRGYLGLPAFISRQLKMSGAAISPCPPTVGRPYSVEAPFLQMAL